jgi:protein-S-isoprenylcysteine O-methyltransferase Ste14
MFDEVKMKTLSYSLMTVGILFVLGGIVAVFNFDQPSDLFSLIWWMIVGGWCLALVGMGIDIIHLFKMAGSEGARVFQSEVNTAKGVEEEATRI